MGRFPRVGVGVRMKNEFRAGSFILARRIEPKSMWDFWYDGDLKWEVPPTFGAVRNLEKKS